MKEQITFLIMFYVMALASVGLGFLLINEGAPAAPYVIGAIWLVILPLLTRSTIQWGKDEKKYLEIPGRMQFGKPVFFDQGGNRLVRVPIIFADEDVEWIRKSDGLGVTYKQYDSDGDPYLIDDYWHNEFAYGLLWREKDEYWDSKELTVEWQGDIVYLTFMVEKEVEYGYIWKYKMKLRDKIIDLTLYTGWHTITLPVPQF